MKTRLVKFKKNMINPFTKNIFIVLMAYFIVIGCHNPAVIESDNLPRLKDYTLNSNLKTYNLKGKVKSVKEIDYEAIDTLGTIQKGELYPDVFNGFYYSFTEYGEQTERSFLYNDEAMDKSIYKHNNKKQHIETLQYYEGLFDNKTIYEYDNKGDLIKESSYDREGSLTEKTTKKYNKKGDPIEIIEYDSIGNITRITTHKYNDKRKITESIFHYPLDKERNKYTYKYDGKGFLIERHSTQNDKSKDRKYIYKNDDRGNAIETKTYDYKGDLTFRTNCKYNDNNKLIEECVYNPNGSIKRKESYVFNDKGDLLEKRSEGYNPNFSDKKVVSYTYQYDKHNNWIQKIQYEDGKAIYITEREITYYE